MRKKKMRLYHIFGSFDGAQKFEAHKSRMLSERIRRHASRLAQFFMKPKARNDSASMAASK